MGLMPPFLSSLDRAGNLVCCLAFLEGHYIDLSTNPLTFTPTGAPPLTLGRGVFCTTGNNLSSASNAKEDLTTYTFLFTVTPRDLSSAGGVSGRQSVNSGWRVEYTTAGILTMLNGDGVVINSQTDAASPLILGQPSMRAIVYTGGTVGNNLFFYTNGVLTQIRTITRTIANPASAMQVGRSSVYQLSKDLGVFVLVNRALTATEVALVSSEIMNWKPATQPYLVADVTGKKQFETGWGSNVHTADQGGVIGQAIQSTPFVCADTTGRYRVEAETINGTLTKVLTTKTAGVYGLPQGHLHCTLAEAAQGAWNFQLNKVGAANAMYFMPIATVNAAWNNAAQNGYRVSINADESVSLERITGGAVAATLFTTAAAYVAINTWYDFRLARTAVNAFTLQIKGGAYTDWTTVGTATDATYTSAPWQIFEFDATDKMVLCCANGLCRFTKRVL